MQVSWTKIRVNFSNAVTERGVDYFLSGRVISAVWQSVTPKEGVAVAEVEGSVGAPYAQTIKVRFDDTRPTVDGTCTCPVGRNCKHVAAALRQLFDRPVNIDTLTTDAGDIAPAKALLSGMTPTLRNGSAQPGLPVEAEVWIARLADSRRAKTDVYPPGVMQRLLYVFETDASDPARARLLSVKTARVLKDGTITQAGTYHNTQSLYMPPRYMLESDQHILRSLSVQREDVYGYGFNFRLEGKAYGEALRRALATGRARFGHAKATPLSEGETRPAKLAWRTRDDGAVSIGFDITPSADILVPTTPPWYIDTGTNTCGPLSTGLADALAGVLAAGPPIAAAAVPAVVKALAEHQLTDVVPTPTRVEEVELANFRPTPVLTLQSHKVETWNRQTGQSRRSFVDTARLEFDYLGDCVSGKKPLEIARFVDGKLMRVRRDAAAEKEARSTLRGLGLEAIEKVMIRGVNNAMLGTFVTVERDAERAWLTFVEQHVPALKAVGFRIDIKRSFRFNLAVVSGWYGEIGESGNDWFNLEVGIEVDGERVSLIPILLRLIRDSQREWTPEAMQRRDDDAPILIPLPDDRAVSLPFGRVRNFVNVLYEIAMRDDTMTKVRLPVLDAARLAALESSLGPKWTGGDALRQLGNQLANFQGIEKVAPPKGFNATLRGYQESGLAWLQFLSQHNLGGVLADDMGLGKTVQTLAHIALEKQHGRLDAPVLVVAPTSMMHVWESEAARFAPMLSVLRSHGLERKASFKHMAERDVVLTTYALLSRDAETLKTIRWHMVILDEAQNIKNAKTKAAAIVSALQTKNRLCLTGTPLENHLGELWSLFNFLLPGFLGDEKRFRTDYRQPIERDGDTGRRQFLARRIKPFLLRRTKSEVAADLPPKTEIIRTVDLAGPQNDLYETVRAAMDKRVREEIAAHGLAKSHIVVLDALLKLRQICCDPRLLKGPLAQGGEAKKPPPSAKLELLMEMLESLQEEGRSILVFSQFASMLRLIEAELKARGLDYVTLTGETDDRRTPVNRFQSGEVKIFLISLKAGGTGLTLTAADVVIHYDPWWNPAAENQATDRAHRIGQDKPVFVYKLVAKATVEEKIVELQKNKAALAASILSGDATSTQALTADDLRMLFEPI